MVLNDPILFIQSEFGCVQGILWSLVSIGLGVTGPVFVDLNLEDQFSVCVHLKYNFEIYLLFYMFRKCKKLRFITRY